MSEKVVIIICFMVFAIIFIICDTIKQIKKDETMMFWENFDKFKEQFENLDEKKDEEN
jgi:uncharacterized ion transporter superfamily protein YfcC